ncbi:GntR family transcriptional regulator [Paraburkholderia sp. BCC1885]|uniref:GntR family transcriptional regulator n=1 Tax=Paraburkholderia sp. BCC1885 TaxID=2562669 RepID=UPI001182ADC7|nr:GntR family transcriptional regulator [Paraburkholderia sp. BCC1885]
MRDILISAPAEAADPLTQPAAPALASPPALGASRANYVYAQLRDDIFELRLLPGDRLTEGAIAERFNVSRTPAREALQRLQGDGLMQGYVRGGWEVVPIDFKRFDDLYEMRELIETFAVRRLCQRDGPLSAELSGLLDQLDAIWLAPPGARLTDGREVAMLDEAFHLALVSATDNDELAAALQRVTDRIRVVRRLDLVYGDCIDETYAEHAVILAAIRAGDTDQALACITQHIHGSQAEVRKLTVHRLHSVRTKAERAAVSGAPPKGRGTI